MKPSTRALIGTIAGFSALGLFAMALIYWSAFTTPQFNLNIGQWDGLLRILAVAAIVAFSIFLVVSPESVGAAASKRSNRLTANAFLVALITFGIGIAINVIVENVPSVRADLTASKEFTLSEQTIKVLQDLDTKSDSVTAYAFYNAQSGIDRQAIEDLLKEYAARTSKLHYEFVDPLNQPAQAVQLGFDQRYGTVVFDNGKKRQTAASASEAEFTSAIVKLYQSQTYTVGFLSGHAERNPEGFDQAGFSSVKDQLTKESYQVKNVSFLTGTVTVTDVNVLIVASPSKALTANEAQNLQKYMDSGGKMLLMLDPEMPADALKPFSDLLAKYGVTPEPGIIIDLASNYSPQDPTVLVARNYSGIGITEALLTNQIPTLFPLALGLRPPTSTIGSMVASNMIQSSAGSDLSWLETDTQSSQVKYDAGSKDIPGPVTFAMQIYPQSVSTTTTVPNTKLVVFGDVDFASNAGLNADPNNIDLFNNSIAWLSGQNELVSIRAKDPTAPRTIILDAGQKSLLAIFSMFALPILVLVVGGFTWWRRK